MLSGFHRDAYRDQTCSQQCPQGAARTLLMLCVGVQVIMATNRADTLDPALLRPGRLDRKIEFPMPDRRQKRLVFQVQLSSPSPIFRTRVYSSIGRAIQAMNPHNCCLSKFMYCNHSTMAKPGRVR